MTDDERGQGPRISIPANFGTYTVIPDALFRPGISARAWGVYAYLRSRPPGWEARAYNLTKIFKEGRDAIYAALNELVSIELMAKEPWFDPENPGLRRFRYVLCDTPATSSTGGQSRRSAPDPENPDTGEPDAGSPDPEDPPQTKKDSVITDPATTDAQDLAAAQGAAAASGTTTKATKRTRPAADPKPRPPAQPKPIAVTFADGTTWTGPVKDFPPNYRIPADDAEMLGRVAKMVVDAYVDQWRADNNVPADELVHDEGRTKVALQTQFVVPALKAGARRWQVERALATAAAERNSTLLLTKPTWSRHLTAARGGQPVDIGSGGRARRAPQVLPAGDLTAPEHEARRAAFG